MKPSTIYTPQMTMSTLQPDSCWLTLYLSQTVVGEKANSAMIFCSSSGGAISALQKCLRAYLNDRKKTKPSVIFCMKNTYCTHIVCKYIWLRTGVCKLILFDSKPGCKVSKVILLWGGLRAHGIMGMLKFLVPYDKSYTFSSLKWTLTLITPPPPPHIKHTLDTGTCANMNNWILAHALLN